MIEIIIIQILILLFSMTIHEVSHGAMADYLGDPTAKQAGRLTLNPLKHLDFVGSLIVPLVLIATLGKGFAWANPVPVNPYNFRDQKYGSLKTALAGPASNLTIALVFGLILRFFSGSISYNLASIFYLIVFINIILTIFNLLPVPPLDGSHILFAFLPSSMDNVKAFLFQFGFFILIFLIFFIPSFSQFLFHIVNLIINIIIGPLPHLI